jgi:hypothetical protein
LFGLGRGVVSGRFWVDQQASVVPRQVLTHEVFGAAPVGGRTLVHIHAAEAAVIACARAVAGEGGDAVHADPVNTREVVGETLLFVDPTGEADPPGGAVAVVPALTVRASGPVFTRPRPTLVQVGLACLACVSRRAGARPTVDAIDARATIGTRAGCTVVDVDVTARATEAAGAGATEAVQKLGAGSAVGAGLRRAFVQIGLTARPDIARHALTAV